MLSMAFISAQLAIGDLRDEDDLYEDAALIVRPLTDNAEPSDCNRRGRGVQKTRR
jgi:hypothetical protein